MQTLQLKTLFAFFLLLSIAFDVSKTQSIDNNEDEEVDGEEAYDRSSTAAVIDDDGDDVSDSTVDGGCNANYVLDHIFLEEGDDENVISDLHIDYELYSLKNGKHLTFDRYHRMNNFTTNLKTQWTPFARELASHFGDLLYEAQLEPICMGALLKMISGIADRKPWALSFVDASGNYLLNGYLSGKMTSLGDYDQCLAITTTSSEDSISGKPIKGQYCLVVPQLPLPDSVNSSEPMAKSSLLSDYFRPDYIDSALELLRFAGNDTLRFGLCLPTQCVPADVEGAINKVLVRKSGFSVAVKHCVTAADEVKLDKYQWAAVIAFIMLAFLVAVSTFYEWICLTFFDILYYPPSAHTLSRQLLTSFSLIRNVNALLEQHSAFSNRKQPLDTLRLLTVLFFFIVNSYADSVLFAPAALQRLNVLGPEMVSSKKYAFLRTHYMMDIFHAISGISFVFHYHKKSTTSSFNYFSYTFRTYVYYVLPILGSIAVIYVVPLLGNGPLWHLFEQTLAKPCKGFSSLVPTLLLITNHEVDFENTCHFPSTFVGLTFQMLLLAPIFTFIATQLMSPKLGAIYLFINYVLITLAHLLARFWYTIKVPFEYQEMTGGLSELKYSAIFYGLSPISHISSLVFGLGVGHLLTRLPPARPSIAGAIGLAALMLHMFGFYLIDSINLKHPQMTEWGAVLVLTLARASYLPFYSWLAYVGIGGQFDLISRFLSAQIWIPLSRLSYGFFLSYLTVILCRLFSTREPVTLSPGDMFISIISDAIISFLISFGLYATIQQPMRNVAKTVCKEDVFLKMRQKLENKNATKLETKKNNIVQNTQL